MEIGNDKKETDLEKEIRYWGQEFEKITEDINKLLQNENDLYKQQLGEITKNHQQKLLLLDKWKEDSEVSIEKDRELKIQYFTEDCKLKKAEIPTFMKQSIQKHFSRLKNEFADVFDLFLQQDIPFINEFSVDEEESTYEVDLSKHHFLSPNEIKKDENKIKNYELGFNNEYIIVDDELKSNSQSFHLESDASIQFEHMSPIKGKITSINYHHSTIDFLPYNSSQPITFSLQALNARIIKIK